MRFAIICAILLFVSCQTTPSPEMTDAQLTAIEQIVRQQGEEVFGSFAALDFDGFMAHFAKDDLSYVLNRATFPSCEALSNLVRDYYFSSDKPRLSEVQFGWDQIRVYVLRPDAAVFHGKYHILQTFTDGRTRNFQEVFWTALHERRDGEWEIVLVHASGKLLSTKEE